MRQICGNIISGKKANSIRKVFYGWAVCAACTILIFITMGSVSNGFSVYLPYIMEEKGLTHAQTSNLITYRCLIAFFSMLVIGRYYRIFSLRIGTAIAALCACAAFLIYAKADTYMMFSIGAGVSGLSYGFGSMIPVSILMNRWFVRNRAFAISICSAGSGIATILLPGITTILVEHFSMSHAFFMEGIGIAFLTALVFLVVRNSPAEKNLQPLGVEMGTKKKTEAPKGSRSGLTKKMWVYMAITSAVMGALANPGFSHLPVLFKSCGFSSATVAMFISMEGFMLIAGKLLFGKTADHIGGFRSTMLFGIILTVGNGMCCLAGLQFTWLGVINMLILGAGYSIATIGPSVWANDFAVPEMFPVVLRRFQVIYAGGALAFASVPGILADHFGGYIQSYGVFTGMALMAVVFIALSYREKKKINDWEI